MNFVILRRLSVALVFGLLLAHLPTGPLAAQALGQVSGRVIAAESDSAVADAYIVLTDLNLAVRTDAAGRFVVRGLPAGRYALLIRAVGRTAVRTVVEVQGDATVTLEVPLNAAAIEVADVTVSASRDAQSVATTPLAIGVIDASELAATRAHHPAELITRTPGAWVSNLGGEGHSTAIRQPITTKAVYQYLEDGIPIRSTGFFNHNGLYEVNLPQAGRLEVIKGPGSAVYGSDAIGGAVNAYTRDPSTNRTAEFSFEGGTAGYTRAMGTVSGGFGSSAIRADLNVTDSDGWRTRAPYGRESATLRWDLRLGANSRLKTVVSGSHIDQPSDGGSDLSRADFDSMPTRNLSPITYRRVEALRFSTEYSAQSGLNSYGATAYARHNALDIMPSWQLAFDPQIWESANRSFGLMLRGRRALPALRTSVSVGIDAEVSPGSRFEQRITPTQAAGIYTGYTKSEIHYDYDVRFWQAAPYLQLAITPITGLSLDLGARYDRLGYDYDTRLAVEDTGSHRIPGSTSVDYQRLTPKIGATYQIAEGVNLYASYRGGFRVPSESQLFRQGAAVSTVDLQPVRAENIETGLKVRLGGVAAFEATVYEMRMHDDILTFFDPGTGLRTAQNAGETRHRGIEAGIEVAPIRPLRVSATATWGEHTYVDWRPRADQDLSGNEMELAPEFFGAFRATWQPAQFGRGSVSAEWIQMGKYWQDPQNTHRYNGHDLVNVFATLPVTANLELVGRVSNLFDERFAETSSFNTTQGERLRPGQPRAFFLTGVYRLGQ
jgi:iron complex outermembrane receptor protein